MLIVSRCLFISACKPLGTLSGLVESLKEGSNAGSGEGGEEGLLGQETLKVSHFRLACPCTRDHVSSVCFIREAS